MSTMARKVIPVHVKALGDRQVETIASTATLDREHDRILASAWRLDAYRRSPVVLWGHDHSMPPIARSLSVNVVGGALRTVDEFPPRGVYEFADLVHDMVKGGFINGKSVGFLPLTWRPNDEGGRDYTAVELLEHSYVGVPAQPQALVIARSKGIRDRATLDAFFRTPRGSAVALRLKGEEEIGWVSPTEIRSAFRTVVAEAVRGAVRAAAPAEADLGLGRGTRDNDLVLILDDEPVVDRRGRREDNKIFDARAGWIAAR